MQEMGPRNFSSVLTLRGNSALVDLICVQSKLAGLAFRMVREVLRPVPAGKRFWMGVLERQSESPSV
jgi:hypothetical protein